MKKSLCIFFTAFGFSSLFAQNLLSDEKMTELKEKGKLSQTVIKSESVDYIYTPDTILSTASIGRWTEEEKPVFVTENLFYVTKDQLKANSKNPEAADLSIDEVSKIIRSISKMKGMIYYSNGDKKWEELYHISNLIVSPKDKTALPDNLEGSADGKTFYCLQDDNSLGKLVYRLDYAQNEKEVSACFTLVESMKIGPIVAVKPDNLKINLTVIEQDEAFLVYMVIQANYPHLSVLENKLNKSFNARVDAIYDWFVKQF